MNAIVTMNKGIENCLAERVYRIFRFICANTGFFADNGFYFHITAAEIQSLIYHFRNSSANPLVVDKTCRIMIHITNFGPRHNNCCDTKLREESLRENTEIQNSGQCRNAISCNIQHFHSLFLCQLGKSRTVYTHFFYIALNLFYIQQLQALPAQQAAHHHANVYGTLRSCIVHNLSLANPHHQHECRNPWYALPHDSNRDVP